MAVDRLVIEASAAIRASITDRWEALDGRQVFAPSLIWSESAAGLRQLQYRREISADEATASLGRLLRAPISVVDSHELVTEALELAGELGWAKTYDAEFVVLARRLDVPLLTVDRRLAATAGRIVRIAAS